VSVDLARHRDGAGSTSSPHPLDHEPGTVHVYSSAASYMLSAIVTA